MPSFDTTALGHIEVWTLVLERLLVNGSVDTYYELLRGPNTSDEKGDLTAQQLESELRGQPQGTGFIVTTNANNSGPLVSSHSYLVEQVTVAGVFLRNPHDGQVLTIFISFSDLANWTDNLFILR